MAVFRPFRGCRYVPQVAGSLDNLLCPPYDMIGPALKESLQSLSPYNAVHLEGGEQPDPVNPEAGYQRAASLFREWLENGALRQEDVRLLLPDAPYLSGPGGTEATAGPFRRYPGGRVRRGVGAAPRVHP